MCKKASRKEWEPGVLPVDSLACEKEMRRKRKMGEEV
jgi:hypothetical protein